MNKNRKSPPTAERPPLTFSRKSVWGWVCLIFLICGWMFFIGVLVGRGTAPLKFDIPQIGEKLKSSLASSEKDGKTSASKDGRVVKDSTELDFYEDLKTHRTDGDSLKLQDPKAVSQNIDTTSKLPVTVKRAQPEVQSPAVETSASPVRQLEEKSEAQKASEHESKSLTVQVASVRNAQDADRLVEKLQKAGYPAYRGIGKIPGKGIWYRVRVGQYATRSEAQKILERLKQDGQKPILVKR